MAKKNYTWKLEEELVSKIQKLAETELNKGELNIKKHIKK